MKWIHGKCSGLKKSEITKIVDDPAIGYHCPSCSRKLKKAASSLSNNITSNFSQSQFDKIMSRFDEMAEIKKDTDEIK